MYVFENNEKTISIMDVEPGDVFTDKSGKRAYMRLKYSDPYTVGFNCIKLSDGELLNVKSDSQVIVKPGARLILNYHFYNDENDENDDLSL